MSGVKDVGFLKKETAIFARCRSRVTCRVSLWLSLFSLTVVGCI